MSNAVIHSWYMALVDKAPHRFLLAKLHLESLSKKINRKAVRAALKTLPTTLDATYANAVQRIYNQAPDLVEIAEVVLFWVLCAKRPLSVLEMRHAYATLELPGGTALEDDDLPDGEILTSVCGGLILLDGVPQTVRVVHYTANEYFARSHLPALATARLSLASISLGYMALPNFSNGPCPTDATMSQRLEQYPFLDYASKYWGEDIGKLSDPEVEDLWPRLKTLVSDLTALEVASQVQNLPRISYFHGSQEYPKNVPPLVFCASFNMPQILGRLITTENYHVEAHGSDRVTALIRAASCGLVGNVRALLGLGADVEARDYMEETASHKAARMGAQDVVQALIDAGANVNARSPYWTVLMSAVSGGNVEVVKMLVQAGADFAEETLWGESALSMALRNGQEAIATFLTNEGAVLPRNSAGRRASVIASRKGLRELARRLTANYEVVAARPLQRQTSRVIGALGEILEELGLPGANNHTPGGSGNAQPEPPDVDEEDFLGVLEGLPYNIGFGKSYKIGAKIGAGHFATVHHCSSRVTGVQAAVKIYKLDKWVTKLADLTFMREEVAFLQTFQQDSHPCILKMINFFAEYEERRTLIVMELAMGGELFHFISNQKQLSERQTRRVFEQLLSALSFLASSIIFLSPIPRFASANSFCSTIVAGYTGM